MFANVAPHTPPTFAAFNGATLLVLLILAAVITCHACRPRVSLPVPDAAPMDAWRDHWAREHATERIQCRSCYRQDHPHAPHPAETGAPCECSCNA